MFGLPTFAVDTDVDIAFGLKVGSAGSLSSVASATLKTLTSASATLEADGLGAFSLDFEAWDGASGEEVLVASGTFDPHNFIALSMGHTTSQSLMYGMITDVGVSFGQGGISLSVTGYDVRHMLRQGRYVRVFDGKTALEICEEICKQRGLTVEVEKGSGALEPVFEFQDAEESDYEYIKRLLGEIGYVLDVVDDAVVIREPTTAPFGLLPTFDPKTMKAFSGTDSVLEQVDGVRVIGTTPERVRVIGDAGATKKDKACVVTLHRNVASKKEAQEIADNELESRQLKKLTASATVRGDATLVPGGWVSITDVPKFTGKYRISKAVHTWSAGAGYTTALTLEQEV